ncbi:MAG: hypothetical protein QGH76_07320 [Phycisphaerales bacterium]|jgi:hypothetical protein|nr:hypothetical protein [Phycisphaerales bacterium]
MLRLAITLTLCFAGVARADRLVFRGQQGALVGRVVSGGEEGVRIQVDDSQSMQVVPWHEIREIQSTVRLPEQDALLKRGERLWRARQRLVRGDITLAEPLFEQVFRELRGASGSDARLAAEGLLRCRIARGDILAAAEPLLETIRLDEAGVAPPFMELGPVIDPETGLSPGMPPVRIVLPAAEVLAPWIRGESTRAAAVAEGMLAMVDVDREAPSIPGVKDGGFLAQIISVSDSARAGYGKARSDLEKALPTLVPWRAMWARWFLARGMRTTGDDADRRAAMLHLAHVAAEHEASQRWLAGAAMLLLADELDKDGRVEQADRIRIELATTIPAHPLLRDSSRMNIEKDGTTP